MQPSHKGQKIRHYLNPFKIARAIQLCRRNLAANFDRQSAKSFPNLGENQLFGFRSVLVGTVLTFL